MFLAINIGNSKINLAVFKENKIMAAYSIDSLKNKDSDFYKKEFVEMLSGIEITECAIISVVNGLDAIVKIACDEAFGISSVVLNYNFAKDLKIKSEHPESAGMDRVANVYAVLEYPLPAIIVDIGTAVTLDVVNEKKEFLGGVIMPGINMSLKALAEGTSKLPFIEPQKSPFAIGNTTELCILSGVIRGTASATDGLIKQCAEELGGCKTIILTGGQAELISEYMKCSYNAVNKELTLFGIKSIYDSHK